jgi:protein ImuA
MDGIATRRHTAQHLMAPILGQKGVRDCLALGHGAADRALRGGLILGALHEVFAGDASAAAGGFTAALAGRVAGPKRLLWIVQEFSALEHGALAPAGLAELGLDPASLLMLRTANAEDALRAGADALTCAALGAVVIEIPGQPKILDLVASRRLVLGTQTKGVTVFLLRPDAQAEPSAAQTRWLIRTARSAAKDDWGLPLFDAELTRNRQGETGRWTMEWDCDDGALREPSRPAAYPGAVVAAPADRPAAAAAGQGWRRAG